MNPRTLSATIVVACVTVLGGCVTTSMQGYADLDRTARPVEHIAVVAPPALVTALATESAKRGLVIEDGNAIVPPTRQTMSAAATPVYRYSRTVAFQARLSEPKSGRNLWVGGGQTRAGGALFMGDATSARDAASAILNNLQEKGLIGAGGA